MINRLLVICGLLLLGSCAEDPIPKPRAYLRLDYPKPEYVGVQPDLPFRFERNIQADSLGPVEISRDGKSKGVNLVYPDLKGTIYLTYKAINDNLQMYLIDAQNLTQKHTLKADEIIEQPYVDEQNRVFGMFYEVGGNAASQSQFYVTDSTDHFITGSLYFYTKPNYDSILPAAYYLRNDIQHLMETIRWKKN
ncbi:MAG: gliding motility lipoprotein GldD [Flavobacteriaceae bacterium]|nr:gliding motility lipoprotein GldD [Flavobacteriaceae bacterium]